MQNGAESPLISIPRDAATVIILRRLCNSTVGDFEVLMVLRHPDSIFVPNCHVFPGGCLDEEDYMPEAARFCQGLDPVRSQRLIRGISQPEKAIGAWVAGIRETFEEVGLLLAYEEDGSLVSIDSEAQKAKYSAYRRALLEGRIRFLDILKQERLTLAADHLHYFSHWITPVPLPYRYDVRFFVAEAPADQEGAHDGLELTGHVWIRPKDALEQNEKGKFGLVLPTIMNLVEVSRFGTIEEVIRSTEAKMIPAILTQMKMIRGEYVEVIPEDVIPNGPLPVHPESGQ
jgi:8-oxo-dGTP pyrophosphatase MutT (NUDIX family)